MLEELFCLVDDFCKIYLPTCRKQLINSGIKKRNRDARLSSSEIMTILIYFHQSHYRNFKHYYLSYVSQVLKAHFTGLVSYNRFVELTKSVMVPLCCFLQTLKGDQTGIYFIDATTIAVCHPKRANRNKVFRGLAKKSKSTMGWYFGFKLHLVINDKGELIAFKVTSSTTDDRHPVVDLARSLSGKLFGDKGYISQKLFAKLYDQGLQLITRLRRNMKAKLMPLIDKLLLRKRSVIETINDQLKNISQLEHTRHRSPVNFMVNVLGALIAYAFQPKKPSINIAQSQMKLLNP